MYFHCLTFFQLCTFRNWPFHPQLHFLEKGYQFNRTIVKKDKVYRPETDHFKSSSSKIYCTGTLSEQLSWDWALSGQSENKIEPVPEVLTQLQLLLQEFSGNALLRHSRNSLKLVWVLLLTPGTRTVSSL